MSAALQFTVDQNVGTPPVTALPRGEVIRRILVEDGRQPYYLYLPTRCDLTHAPVLVTVHGISRNARTHARRYAALAERRGVIIVAPRFARSRFPDYQRLGRLGRGERADQMLDRILAEVGRLTGAATGRLYLFGYSGGGQFVHRYAMANPGRVAAMAIGAAGWYTFPDPERRYPYGIKSAPSLPGVSFNAGRFLQVPAWVLVGEEDDARDAALRQTPRVDHGQGATRLERGQRWVEAMNAAAYACGLMTPYRFIPLAGADHSFSRSVQYGAMAEHVFTCLFGGAPGTK